MSDLPPELVEEILSRVPALSLMTRLRSTCKRWNVLFRDQRFTMKHFYRASKQVSAYMLHENKFISLTVNLHDNKIASPFIGVKGEVGFTEDIMHVSFHCDGLFLCTTKNDRVAVWNPCTGETKLITPYNHYYRYSMFALGYENNKSCRNYKVLRYRSDDDLVYGFEIYELTSASWRVLEVTANFPTRDHGVSLKGNTYWLNDDNNYLLSFDFSTERLVRLHLPFKGTVCCTAALSIVSEEKLSVLHQSHDCPNKIEVWVATSDKIDVTIVLSWKRFLAVDMYKLSGHLELFSWLSFFIDEEKKMVVCCCNRIGRYGYISNIQNMVFVIGEYGVYKEIKLGVSLHKYGRAIIFNYTPSLVQIQESTVTPRSDKRKRTIT